MTENAAPIRRRIKSFVLRTGRMTDGQRRAYEINLAELGLQRSDGMQNFENTFGRVAPVVLEIGFGMGDSLAEMAANAPENDFIGVEVHTPGVGRLMYLVQDAGLKNVRTYEDDAVEVLAQCIPDNSLSRVQVYFPDPWHKARHHKRRLIQPQFVQALRSKLNVGGVLHLATDWENYAEHMMDVMSEAEGYSNMAGDRAYSPRPDYRPITKFEKRGERLGHGVWDLLFTKVS
ncbi:tRNA (guanosine(46)-N7)-methyltransferase TrmB [Zhongshania marina]|uniref:tRNA (guanine-N(7)-)-methyltransferase n=1 Tax=Zhongshania marina TaxID=2304603 RepID=A0A2S4HJZ0_9GAMM|nr:tRNA (guanosine(46)-N7)-methyltransferase TrmB [Marortus luteolus]POP54314.1 tRNA (guanosine(46)-N7)-methyltransferase TrmB [Marortus luteolus]RNL61886.1 tRNA (guanosine(46)-N7)-methyltransferase TrmB [Zhongshania marina]